jgi:hypothetical protein
VELGRLVRRVLPVDHCRGMRSIKSRFG